MPRKLYDSPYLFGIHEPGGEDHMLHAGKPGWVLFTEAIGSESNDHGGKNFSSWSDRGLGVICRLNNGYEPAGTIPHSNRYESFAQRCANYVRASQGCKIWIIGNEMNYAVERPGVQIDWSRAPSRGVGPEDPSSRWRYLPERFNALRPPSRSRSVIVNPGEVITPDKYARCYRLCRDAIHGVNGHQDDQVLVGAVAPWNTQTSYPGNPAGDWVQYFVDILELIGSTKCDGFTLHAYTHSPNPGEIYTDQTMNPPFQHRQYNFRTYRDFLKAVPAPMRHLPTYITEADQDVPWLDENNGWVQRAYGEIDHWNKQPGNQQVRALILYRWPNKDQWVIEGKHGVINDFRQSLQQDYRWHERPMPEPVKPVPKPTPKPASFKTGQQIYTVSPVNLRRSPGYRGKGDEDVQAVLPKGHPCTVIEEPQTADDLVWWCVRSQVEDKSTDGWLAQATPSGKALVDPSAPSPPPEPQPEIKPEPAPSPVSSPITLGTWVNVHTTLNVRRSPGWRSKPAGDVIHTMPAGSEAQVFSGPQEADDLTWWRIRHAQAGGPTVEGWAAEASSSGRAFMSPREQDEDITPRPIPEPQAIQIGDTVVGQNVVNLRRTPGWRGKPAGDIVYEVPAGMDFVVLEGPQESDNLTWWQVRFVSQHGNPFTGWAAQATASGLPLLAKATKKPSLPLPEPTPEPTPPGRFKLGQHVYTTTYLTVRRSIGYVNKTAGDVLDEAPHGTEMTVLSGPMTADKLTWWRVRYLGRNRQAVDGWVAEEGSSGRAFLSDTVPAPPKPVESLPTRSYRVGDQVYNAHPNAVNVRRSPGFRDKPADDVLVAVPGGTDLVIAQGPQVADNLTWWQVKGMVAGTAVEGWIAEVSPSGKRFLVPARFKEVLTLGKPFTGSWRVTQLFADNPQFYRRWTYNGVPLRGHNGIDFGTPNGTDILATDDGKVVEVGFDKDGFGNYVKLEHPWGESIYAHMDRVSVAEGVEVQRGTILGPSDNTGGSTGPHLHFAIRIYPYRRGDGWGGCCDPQTFMAEGDLIIPDSIRAMGFAMPSGMSEELPGRRRP
jgi:murein DD-endopeptidase MepM/ murein hydrolase activator NlpD